jgi:hypothetical protein
MGLATPLFNWNFPWRPPDLCRFTRTSQFRELRSAAGAWIEQEFARIQAEAPWLIPANRLVSDYGTVFGWPCRSSWDGGLWGVRFGVSANIRFQRQVAVAYGFDDAVADQIPRLVKVLQQGGWERPRLWLDRPLTSPIPVLWVPEPSGDVVAHWQVPPRRDDLAQPPLIVIPGPHTSGWPPCQTHMVWTTRDQPARITLDPAFPPDPRAPRRRKANYQPLEFRGARPTASVAQFARPALEQHENAVAIMIELGYYVNQETATPAHQLPKKLIPALW